MTTVTFAGGMRFVGRGASGHDVVMDADSASGGQDSAARPVEVLLAALGGCTGMDVVSILRKSRQEATGFRIEIAVERASEYPKVLKRIHLTYIADRSVPQEKLEKAIRLSLEKYCPIANTLSGVAKISYDMRFE